ncbi:MAG: hypothetical protein WCK49_06625 [Myxococcaceae bacterium]
MKQIPCFQHPTTILVVDDNQIFRDSLEMHLLSGNDRYIFVDGAEKALAVLKASPQMPMMMDLRSFPEIAYNPERFDIISGIIADYEMPNMSGLALCEQVKSPIDKILLTGVTDEQIAINAFNQKLIHRYVNKRNLVDMEELDIAIERGKQDYFNRITQFHQHLIVHDERETTLLDPAFIEFFWKTRAELGAVEHYLLDPIGCFVFVDEFGHRSTLHTYNEELLKHLSESGETQNLPKNLQTICGKQKYYCAVVDDIK